MHFTINSEKKKKEEISIEINFIKCDELETHYKKNDISDNSFSFKININNNIKKLSINAYIE